MELDLDKVLSESFVSDLPVKFVDYKGCFYTDRYEEIADSVENFEVRDDDIWVCSFPKAGTTWTQEMVWMIANDLDFEGAKVFLRWRFPFLESASTAAAGWMSPRKPDWERGRLVSKTVEYIKNLSSPRFIKTHLPFHLLPRQLRERVKKAKIIYVTRNPKDTCVSCFYHYQIMHGFCGTFDNFCQLFLGNKIMYAPYWDHINGYWENQSDKNILFLKYEDMKANLPLIIRKTADFLGKTLSERQIEVLEDHLSFTKMKINPSVNYQDSLDLTNQYKLFGENFKVKGDFIRSGVVGQWKISMSEDMIEKFDEWIAKNLKRFPNLQNVI